MTDSNSPFAARALASLALSAFLAISAAASAQVAAKADELPGNAATRDSVTNWLCVGGQCDFVRMPRSNCICQKMNPLEQNVTRLELKCSTTDRPFHWVQCPVRPPFGIDVR